MLKKILSIAVMIIMIFCTPGNAYKLPDKVLLTDIYQREYRDVNKTWDGDSNLCWAATLSNMISFARNDNKAQEYFDTFKRISLNLGNISFWALRAFCQETNENKDVRYCDLFRDSEAIVTWYNTKDIMTDLIMALNQHKVIYLGISNTIHGGGHAVTLYGYDTDEDGNLYFHIVDNDDKKREMYRIKVSLERHWIRVIWALEDTDIFGPGWYIHEFMSLPINDKSTYTSMQIFEERYKFRNAKEYIYGIPELEYLEEEE
jgi:hypothetical protein